MWAAHIFYFHCIMQVEFVHEENITSSEVSTTCLLAFILDFWGLQWQNNYTLTKL